MCLRCYNRYPGCNCDIFAYIEPCENGSVNDLCHYTEDKIINVDFGRCYHHSMTDYTPINNQGPTPGSIITPPTSEDETPVPMANSAPAHPLDGMESSDSDSDWSDVGYVAQDVLVEDEQDIMLGEDENHDEEEEINSDSGDYFSALESPDDQDYYNAYGVTDQSDSGDDSTAGDATNAGPGIMDPFVAPAPTEYMSRNIALNERDNTGTETIQDTDIDDPDAPDSNDARREVAGLRARREAVRRDYFERTCREVKAREARHQAMLEWQQQQAMHQRQQQQGVFTITPQSLQDNAAPNVVNARARAAMLRYLADLAGKLSRGAQQDRER
ncbi:hypothetical protein F5X68DRAFT_194135 [Plectosphaerella plurivora]|uniref:Uncharacterized protein n=1 Tax=Plectosphaerella plurivora TaxID=936078 RepID=A0A9P8V4J6_9PEZI|nr:hypothetical protein F5X68DRAFT_194135 [Plectosphaerella plurivora]